MSTWHLFSTTLFIPVKETVYRSSPPRFNQLITKLQPSEAVGWEETESYWKHQSEQTYKWQIKGSEFLKICHCLWKEVRSKKSDCAQTQNQILDSDSEILFSHSSYKVYSNKMVELLTMTTRGKCDLNNDARGFSKRVDVISTRYNLKTWSKVEWLSIRRGQTISVWSWRYWLYSLFDSTTEDIFHSLVIVLLWFETRDINSFCRRRTWPGNVLVLLVVEEFWHGHSEQAARGLSCCRAL